MDVGSSLIGVQKQLADVEEVDLLRTGWKIRGEVGTWGTLFGWCDDVYTVYIYIYVLYDEFDDDDGGGGRVDDAAAADDDDDDVDDDDA